MKMKNKKQNISSLYIVALILFILLLIILNGLRIELSDKEESSSDVSVTSYIDTTDSFFDSNNAGTTNTETIGTRPVHAPSCTPVASVCSSGQTMCQSGKTGRRCNCVGVSNGCGGTAYVWNCSTLDASCLPTDTGSTTEVITGGTYIGDTTGDVLAPSPTTGGTAPGGTGSDSTTDTEIITGGTRTGELDPDDLNTAFGSDSTAETGYIIDSETGERVPRPIGDDIITSPGEPMPDDEPPTNCPVAENNVCSGRTIDSTIVAYQSVCYYSGITNRCIPQDDGQYRPGDGCLNGCGLGLVCVGLNCALPGLPGDDCIQDHGCSGGLSCSGSAYCIEASPDDSINSFIGTSDSINVSTVLFFGGDSSNEQGVFPDLGNTSFLSFSARYSGR